MTTHEYTEMPSHGELVENRKEMFLEQTALTEREAEIVARAWYKDSPSEVVAEMPIDESTARTCYNSAREKLGDN